MPKVPESCATVTAHDHSGGDAADEKGQKPQANPPTDVAADAAAHALVHVDKIESAAGLTKLELPRVADWFGSRSRATDLGETIRKAALNVVAVPVDAGNEHTEAARLTRGDSH